MCQEAGVSYPRCTHTYCPHSSAVSTCNLKNKSSIPEILPPSIHDILPTKVQLCPPCYRKEEIAILTIYTTAINEQCEQKAGKKSTLTAAGNWKQARECDVDIANLKIEMVDTLTKLREGQGVPKLPEKKHRVEFDSRGPEIMHVENWVGKDNLWPDENGDIELDDAK